MTGLVLIQYGGGVWVDIDSHNNLTWTVHYKRGLMYILFGGGFMCIMCHYVDPKKFDVKLVNL